MLNPGLSGHHPILIAKGNSVHPRSPFCYFNAWAREDGFFNIVKEVWVAEVRGSPMFQVVSKLKRVKKAISSWRK